MDLLEKEYRYYQAQKIELLKKYEGKFLVIKGEEILGVYDTEAEAYKETTKTHKLGTFLIQPCIKDEEKLIQTFYSRVVI